MTGTAYLRKGWLSLFIILTLSQVFSEIAILSENDFNQLKRYISLTTLDEKILYEEWTNCQNLLSQNYGRNWRCVSHQTERIGEMNGTLKWTRKTDSGSKLLPDCEYTVFPDSGGSDISDFRFLIQQTKCGYNGVLGGASFQVSASSAHSIAPCDVTDFFNNTYRIVCSNVECQARHVLSKNPISAARISREPAELCLNITIILDYEHFDAYSETKSNEPPLRVIITNNTISCISSNNPNVDCPQQEHFWVHNYGTHDLSDYEWISNSTTDASFPEISTVLSCLQNHKLTFLIDGQLNMVSHYLEELYIDSYPQSGLRLDKVDRNFVLDTQDFFGSTILPSCGDKTAHSYVFEFGNFDLRHTPPRNLISNPLTLLALLQRIKEFLYSDKCSNVRLIWVDMAPVHKCIRSVSTCVHELDTTWSNNYATNAVNGFFRSELLNLTSNSIDKTRLTVISRFQMLSSRIMSETFVCNYLYVCKTNGEDNVQTTASFRAVVAETLRAACDRPTVPWEHAYSHVDKFYHVSRNESKFYYYTMKGIRRRIPDEETLVYLQLQTEHGKNSSTELVTDKEIASLPLDPSILPYPTRKTGSLISPNGAVTYVMDDGRRRPLALALINNHTEKLFHLLGRDHSNVKIVSINDLNIIPIGTEVSNLQDLFNITGFEHHKNDTNELKLENAIKIAAITYKKLLPCLFDGDLLKSDRKVEYPLDAESHYYDILERTTMFRNQPMHFYAGYDGPWIENYFIDAFIDKPLSYFRGFIPLFIQWVDVMVAAGDFPYIVKTMKEILRPDVLYLAVSQSDVGLGDVQRQHPNILVISAGGWGHIPIPLIKSELTLAPLPSKFIHSAVFFGNTKQHSRPEAFANIKKSFTKHNVSYKIDTYTSNCFDEYRVSKFILAPRGYGRSSFRFSEIVQFGRVPIYVYDDYEWLPYQGTNASIQTYGISVRNTDSMEELARKLVNITDDSFRQFYDRIASIRYLFTYKGVIEQIRLFITDSLGPQGGYLRCTRIPQTPNRRRRS